MIKGGAVAPSMGGGRVHGLDVMRAVAISGVLLGHAGLAAFGSDLGEAAGFVFAVLAGAGVEVFFLLSGFLMGGIFEKILIRGDVRRDVPVFFLRRWMRTLPLYYAALALHLAWPAVAGGVAEEPWRYVVFLQNVSSGPGVFNVSWSLSIEEWFYALSALAVAVSAFAPAVSARTRLAVIAFAFIIASIGLRLAHLDGAKTEADFRLGLIYRFDVIAIGLLGFVFIDRLKRLPRAPALSVSFIAVFAIAARDYYEPAIGSAAVDFISKVLLQGLIGIACLPALGAFAAWSEGGETRAGGLVRGQAKLAYALYLFHLPMMEAVRLFVPTWLRDQGLALTACGLVLAYASAYAVHRLIEKPIMARRPAQPADAARPKDI